MPDNKFDASDTHDSLELALCSAWQDVTSIASVTVLDKKFSLTNAIRLVKYSFYINSFFVEHVVLNSDTSFTVHLLMIIGRCDFRQHVYSSAWCVNVRAFLIFRDLSSEFCRAFLFHHVATEGAKESFRLRKR